MNRIDILTHDPRFAVVGKALQDLGYTVSYQREEPKEKRAYLFSLGAKTEEVAEKLSHAYPGSLALVGKADEVLTSFCREGNIRLLGLLEKEDYLRENSAATAEGVLAEVILKSERVLKDLCVLVCGYGHCGKEIARLLWLCGCEVFVFSRENSRKRAEEDGFSTLSSLSKGMGIFDLVINTVEDAIFDDEVILNLRSGCRFFQVASGFSGLCADRLREKNIFFTPLPGLPGRVAPFSEADAILNILLPELKKERENP